MCKILINCFIIQLVPGVFDLLTQSTYYHKVSTGSERAKWQIVIDYIIVGRLVSTSAGWNMLYYH